MSYAAVRTALALRLQAVSKVGKAHSFVRYSKAGPSTEEFKALFISNERVNVWQITRVSFADAKAASDDTTVVRTHQLEIYAIISQHDATCSENDHQDALDAVAGELKKAPRNLGGACFSHSLADVSSISRVMFYEKILCHEATIKLTVEEHL